MSFVNMKRCFWFGLYLKNCSGYGGQGTKANQAHFLTHKCKGLGPTLNRAVSTTVETFFSFLIKCVKITYIRKIYKSDEMISNTTYITLSIQIAYKISCFLSKFINSFVVLAIFICIFFSLYIYCRNLYFTNFNFTLIT